MRFLTRAWRLLWPGEDSFAELEQLQARLLRSLLYTGAFFALILLFRRAFSPRFPFSPILFFGLLVGLCLWLQRRRPSLGPWILRGLLAGSIAASAGAMLQYGSAVAPSLFCLILFGLVGTVLDSPRSGNLATLAGLGVLILARLRFPPLDMAEKMLWFNLTSSLLLGQLINLGFHHVLVGLQGRLNAQAQRLSQANSELRRLTGALLEGLQGPVQRLQAAAARPLEEGGAVLRDTVRAVADHLQASASLRREPLEPEALPGDEADLDGLGRRFMPIPLWAALLATLAAALNNWIHHGSLGLPLGLAAFFAAALYLVPRMPWQSRSINAAQLLLYVGLFVWGLWKDGMQGLPPTLPYLLPLVLAAALLLGYRGALLVAALGAVLILWIWIQGSPSLLQAISLGDLLLILVLLCALCRQVWRLHAQLLQLLRQRAETLGEALRQHRRLLGTLFHDINNPLAAIQSILQLPQVGVPLVPQDQQRVQNMAARIQQMVGAAATFYLVDSDVPASSLLPVDVPRLFADMQDLFEARLNAKRQQLHFSAPPSLAVLSLPGVLRDSVLSNLVSNALKFSPPGAQIFLETRLRNGDVGLVLRDTGRGLPLDVLQSLEQGMPVSTRPGTGGEQGQGLGLGLVQEHLRRLGGHLELERLAGGGTEARVWLKRA